MPAHLEPHPRVKQPMTKAVRVLKSLMPPVLWNIARRLRPGPASRPRFVGPMNSWQEAVAASDGWDAPEITAKTLDAARQVRDGHAAFERDAVTSQRIKYSPLILAALCLALSRKSGPLHIIDFGGSLGSHYFQHRKVLRDLIAQDELRWSVVEQAALVQLGREEFETPALKFFHSSQEAAARCAGAVDLFMFTGSLQYLSEPFSELAGVAASGVSILAVDRTSISPGIVHEIHVQQPDANKFYSATYPTWTFAREPFIEQLSALGFTLIAEFPSRPGEKFDSCGMLFCRT